VLRRVSWRASLGKALSSRLWPPKVFWTKLVCMNGVTFAIRSLAVGFVLSCSIVTSQAQNGASTGTPDSDVVLTRLAQFSYPPLARQARITGDVELTLQFGSDGTVQSAIATSGHPLLKQAALDSARQSQFECKNCREALTAFRLVYTFQLAGSENCCAPTEATAKTAEQDQVLPRIIQSEKHVTLIDRVTCICDPAADVRKVRALKCLYLWKCGSR